MNATFAGVVTAVSLGRRRHCVLIRFSGWRDCTAVLPGKGAGLVVVQQKGLPPRKPGLDEAVYTLPGRVGGVGERRPAAMWDARPAW